MTRPYPALPNKKTLAPETEKCTVTVVFYNEGIYQNLDLDSALSDKRDDGVLWINIVGIPDIPLLQRITRFFGIHPLAEQYILNTEERPKIEDFESSIFMILKDLHYNKTTSAITTEQLNFLVKKNVLITIQEQMPDIFEPTYKELSSGQTHLRKEGTDFLTYILVDKIINKYYYVLEEVAERLDILEDDLVNNPTKQTLEALYRIKKEIMYLVHSIWPLREIISVLERERNDIFKESMQFYFRNISENVFQIIDTVSFLRDLTSEMMDIYLSSINNRINDVMKVLTMIATIFIPLSFVVGIYGMNFRHMPELDWIWGYPIVLGICLVVALFMLYFFRKKKWL